MDIPKHKFQVGQKVWTGAYAEEHTILGVAWYIDRYYPHIQHYVYFLAEKDPYNKYYYFNRDRFVNEDRLFRTKEECKDWYKNV